MAISSGAGPHQAWLAVNGTTLPIEHGSVSQEATRKSSSFSAVVPMSYPGARQLLADLGENEATITVMTRGQTATLLTGEVDTADFDYISRVIHIAGRDKSAKLHDKKSSEKHINKMPSDVVSDLISRVGLSGNVTASSLMAGKQLHQDFVHLTDNVSYAYVIHKLAQLDNARWWVDAHGQFNYVPMGSPQGVYSITINQNQQPVSADCLALQICRNIQAGKSIKVKVSAWHPKLKRVFSHTSNVDGRGGSVEYNYHVPGLTQDHVTKHAKSRASERARHEFTVRATVVGDPNLSAGMGLQLRGTDFDQLFEIDTSHHEFGMSGHTTSITARAPKSGRSAT